VLCVQPTSLGPAVWASSRARAGDFVGIARDAFSVTSLAMRTQIVRATLDQVSRRQRNAPFAQIDLARIAVAGFDLGAQTALIVAGQNVPGVDPLQLPDGVKAVIALSPYADRAAVESLYQPIRLPVLSVTSGMDRDAYGLIASPSLRRAPFQFMPSGGKYLLLFASAPHVLLAGAAPATPRENREVGDASTADDDKILGDETAEVYEGRPKKRRKPDNAASRADKLAQQLQVHRQVQAITTAYLDALLRNDAAATQWLTQNAKTWLGDSAELEFK